MSKTGTKQLLASVDAIMEAAKEAHAARTDDAIFARLEFIIKECGEIDANVGVHRATLISGLRKLTCEGHRDPESFDEISRAAQRSMDFIADPPPPDPPHWAAFKSIVADLGMDLDSDEGRPEVSFIPLPSVPLHQQQVDCFSNLLGRCLEEHGFRCSVFPDEDRLTVWPATRGDEA